MNRDKLDNQLRSKLRDARVSPPPDMWDRIAATLREEGLTAVAPAAKPSITIRRPRRLRFGYAAAVAVLLCALVFGIRQFDIGDGPVVTQDGTVQDMPFEIVTRQQIEDLIADATIVRREPPAVFALSQPMILPGKEPFMQTPELVWDEGPMTFMAVTIPDKTGGDNDARLTEWVDRAEIERMLANAAKEEKRTQPFSVGLYSSNLGNTSSEKVVTNRTVRAAVSDLTVTETTNGVFSTSAPAVTTVKLKHKMPLSVGVGLTVGITDRLSLESGTTYTYMFSESENPSRNINGTTSLSQELHYVGVPVGVKYDFVRGGRIDVYAGAAALFEMCVSSKRTTKVEVGGVVSGSVSDRLNARGVQPSVGVHAGAEVKLVKRVGLYIEPGMNYYFEAGRQPENYRTENPLNFSLRAGLRIKLK